MGQGIHLSMFQNHRSNTRHLTSKMAAKMAAQFAFYLISVHISLGVTRDSLFFMCLRSRNWFMVVLKPYK